MSAVPGPESELRSFKSNRADGARDGDRGAANEAIRDLLKVTFRSIGLHDWIHCTCLIVMSSWVDLRFARLTSPFPSLGSVG